MKLLIPFLVLASCVFAVPSHCQTDSPNTSAPAGIIESVHLYYYSHGSIGITISYTSLDYNPYVLGSYGYNMARCFLDKLSFQETNTSIPRTFTAEYQGFCRSSYYYSSNNPIVDIAMSNRDYFRFVTEGFVGSQFEMYTNDRLFTNEDENDFMFQEIRKDDPVSVITSYNLNSLERIQGANYLMDGQILLVHFSSPVYQNTLDVTKIAISNSSYIRSNDTLTYLTGGIVESFHPSGIVKTVAIRLTSTDQDQLSSLCHQENNIFATNCFLFAMEGVAVPFIGNLTAQLVYGVSIISRLSQQTSTPVLEPVYLEIRVEYIGYTTSYILGEIGEYFLVQFFLAAERVISVRCVSTSPAHINPTLAINNGGVNISDSFLTQNWPTSVTLTANNGLYESGLFGYYTCRTEGNTYNSYHIIHSDPGYFFFYEGATYNVELHEDLVIRVAYAQSYFLTIYNTQDRYNYPILPFQYTVYYNTPTLNTAEIHINRTQFSYSGVYFLTNGYVPYYIFYEDIPFPSSRLFTLEVTSPELTLSPAALTVMPSDTMAMLTCTCNNPLVPVELILPASTLNYITVTHVSNSSVRLVVQLNEDRINELEGAEISCIALDPDDLNNTVVSVANTTFRGVTDILTLVSIDENKQRSNRMPNEMVQLIPNFECLGYGPSGLDLFWRIYNIKQGTIEEIREDRNDDPFLATIRPNILTLSILGEFSGTVDCVSGVVAEEVIGINVVTVALAEGVDYIELIDISSDFTGQMRGTDDGCSNRIYVDDGIPYGAATHNYIHMCTNGLLTVGSPPLNLGIGNHFPSTDSRISQTNILAAFWNDHDVRSASANIYYKIYNEGDVILGYVSQFVSAQLNMRFMGTWMIVGMWKQVPPFPHTANRGMNTYELILITDGKSTYSVYIYYCGDLEWGESQNGDHSIIGYNINTESALGSQISSFVNHRLSGLPRSNDIACSNIPRGSRWYNELYHVGEANDTSLIARTECLIAIRTDTVMKSLDINIRSQCPCTSAQAWRDFAFRIVWNLFDITRDTLYNDHWCFVRGFAPETSTVMCCYRHSDGALSNKDGVSGIVQYNPARKPQEFVEYDHNLRRKCIVGGLLQTRLRYRLIRPELTCVNYRPPRRAACAGDPHLTTLDGGRFTFNGWGEYLLMKFQTNRTMFELQTRTAPVSGTKATELVAFAFAMMRHSPVEIRLSATRELEIYLNGTDYTAQLANTNDSFVTSFLSVVRTSSNSVLATFRNGMAVQVNATRMLSFTMIVPDVFSGLPRGMIGNFNGNMTDDVMFRNGTVVTENVNDRLIHEVGQSWQLTDEESLFTYPDGLTHFNYSHPDHIPPFLDEVIQNPSDEIQLACGNSIECKFDAIETRDINVGVDTMTTMAIIDEDEKLTSNLPPFITGPDTLLVTLGEEIELQFNVTDDKDIIFVTLMDGLPAGASLMSTLGDGYTEYTFRWTVIEVINISLVFVASDELDATSTLSLQVLMCGCQNGGNCILDGVLDQSTSTILLNCNCTQGWDGEFCERDEDGCASFDCFAGIECIDIPAPGVGAICGDCPLGYLGDGAKCADINECNSTTNNCDQLCVNLPGSFECACFPGYQLVRGTDCEDINECSLLNGGCHQDCQNTEGGFLCSCNQGYKLSSDNRTCEVQADAMCMEADCEQSCVRLSGDETCGCFPGYQLDGNAINCTSIDECVEGPCEQLCTDLEGGYQCGCVSGYQLLSGGQCEDIDECLEAALNIFAVDLCDPTFICVNSEGSYSCQCPDGTIPVDGVCTEPALLTTAPPVALPEEAIPHTIVVELQGFTAKTFTGLQRDRFKEATAVAINNYCENSACPTISSQTRARRNVFSAENVFITDIQGESSVMFSMYVLKSGDFLSSSVLLMAVEAHQEDYSAQGFHVISVQLLASPAVLSTNQIIGIAVGGALGLLMVLLVVVIVFCCVCTRHLSDKTTGHKHGNLLYINPMAKENGEKSKE